MHDTKIYTHQTIFHRIFSYEIYELGRSILFFGTVWWNITCTATKNHSIENQSGATAFLLIKPLGLKELLTQSFANWHRSTWRKKKTKYN